MRRATATSIAIALAVAGLGGVARGAKPPKPPKPPPPPPPVLSIFASPNPIAFGSATTISGRLTGSGNSGVIITLQQSPYPYQQAYANVTTARTNAVGAYSFGGVRPGVNTAYRVRGRGNTSAVRIVNVRIRIGLSVSDFTPARGQRVRFSGTVAPPHNGRFVLIQRRDRAGAFRTVTRAPLAPWILGTSRYSVRKAIFSTGVYRARVSSDGDHVAGTTGTRTLRVH